MNRRDFLKILALSAWAPGAIPAATIPNELGTDEWPPIARRNQAKFAEIGERLVSGLPRIGIVAAGSGACGILGQLQDMPYLARRVVIDTSPFALYRTMADHYVWVGRTEDKATDPNTVRFQAKAAKSEICDAIQGLDLIWLVSSLGSSAGTGIAPIVADVARELGIPVIAASITPFSFEGARRNQVARAGLNAITRRVAASIELPNETFAANADDELLNIVLGRAGNDFEHLYRATSSVFSQQGLIGVDLEDFWAVTAGGRGLVAFGLGTGNAQDALGDAFAAATNHVLLGAERLRRAKGVFVAIQLKSGSGAMSAINKIMQSMTSIHDPDTLLVYGAVIDSTLTTDAYVSILAAL